MSIVNALRVKFNRGAVWVTDPASIATFGRIEAHASYSVDDQATAAQLGQMWLSTRSQPQESHVFRLAETAGKWIGDDIEVGDTATVAGVADQRLMEVRWDLNELGEIRATAPGFQSRLHAQRRADEAKAEWIIAAQGGSGPGTSPVDIGVGGVVGKLTSRPMESWSTWNDDDIEDGEVWQSAQVDAPVRIARIVLASKDISDADGTTRIRLQINGADALAGPEFGNLPTDVVLDPSDFVDDIEVYGHTVLGKGQNYGFRVVSWGGHKKMSLSVFGADPL